MINFNHLYYFFITVREGGVTPGARKLLISQPALSAQIKQLEAQLKLKLFQKAGRKLELTEKGAFVYGFARQMFELSEEMTDQLRQTGGSKGARVRIGVTDEIERSSVVRLIGFLFKSRKGGTQPMVKLVAGSHDELVRQLRDRSLDVVLSNHAHHPDEIETVASARMPVLLAVSKEQAPPRAKGRKQDQIFVKKWLENSELGLALPSTKLRLRREIDYFLEKNRISAPLVFESDVLASVERAVVDGVGVSFLPAPYATADVERGELELIGPKAGLWQHSLRLMARRKRTTESLAVNELVKAFEKMALGMPEV